MSSALRYLKSQDIVHNDIKPGNIAYSQERGAVLLDFGLASTSREATSTGGTPWYVPLEYITQGIRGAQGDKWALGVTMMYVLGKIRLPERSRLSWLIRDAIKQEGQAQSRMIDWINVVQDEKEKLDLKDNHEAQIAQLLELEPGIRGD